VLDGTKKMKGSRFSGFVRCKKMPSSTLLWKARAVICKRCGFVDQSNQISKRVERSGSQECASCLARPASTIKTAFGVCRPHKGEFDDHDNPLDHRGKLFRAGIRLCGNSDCIAKSHIQSVSVQDLEAERLDLSYRTGKKLSFRQLLEKVKKEGKKNGHNNTSASH
jgi:hypothetical protein